MPRFVLLRHEPGPAGPRSLHWDLMLETATGLRTWALDALPQAGSSTTARPLPDHRKAYLDYEGPVSGERGTVSRVDCGTFEFVVDTDVEVIARLTGADYRGVVTIRRESDQRSVAEFAD